MRVVAVDVPPGLAGPPVGDVAVPAAVTRLAAGRPLRPVWENVLGGLTYEIPGYCYVKWAPPGVDLSSEVERLAWAAPFITVPKVLQHGADSDGSWLVTEPLPGRNAVEARWLAEPQRAVDAVGKGLRALHEALPPTECPFSWDVATRRVGIQDPDPQRWRDRHDGLTLTEALRILDDAPEPDRLVVCHGDACVPNTLIDDEGDCCGHVDLGSLGVADRWADLAAATWSTVWNYGPGHERRLLDAYGVAPDPERLRYYRILWDLTSASPHSAEHVERAPGRVGNKGRPSLIDLRLGSLVGWKPRPERPVREDLGVGRLDWDQNLFHHRLLLRQLPSRCERVLDVGCGAGALARELAVRADRVDAVDRSPDMIRLARAEAPANVECVAADFMTYDLPDGAYDAVLSLSSLHHLPLASALQRMAAALRPGGVLIAIALPKIDLPRELGIEAVAASGYRLLGMAFAAARATGRSHGFRRDKSHDAMPVVLDPVLTTRAVRAAAADVLPGVRVRRLIFWRYLLTWHKPVA